MNILDIGKDFSPFPAGRFVTDGPYPGEKFRKTLTDFLREGVTEVFLDGTMGYGSSFLEEAFGGLVRKRLFTADQLHERLILRTSDPTIEAEIWEYIDSASPDAS